MQAYDLQDGPIRKGSRSSAINVQAADNDIRWLPGSESETAILMTDDPLAHGDGDIPDVETGRRMYPPEGFTWSTCFSEFRVMVWYSAPLIMYVAQ